MNVTEWTNLLKTRNAKNKLAGDATVLGQQAALSTWVNGLLVAQGANPALWDYPPGISLASSLTGNSASTVVTLPQDYIKNRALSPYHFNRWCHAYGYHRHSGIEG